MKEEITKGRKKNSPINYEEVINGLIDIWEKDTIFLSYQDIKHPAFTIVQKIDPNIVIPIVLKRMQQEITWFFIILSTIVPQEDWPTFPEETVGKIKDRSEVWIEWGKKKGIIE